MAPSYRLKVFRIILFIFIRPCMSLVMSFPLVFRRFFQIFSRILFLLSLPMWRSKVRRSHEKIAGIDVVWLRPNPSNSNSLDTVVLYIHGGGFTIGSFWNYGSTMAKLVMDSGCSLVFVEYGLSPDYRFPSALEQLQKVFQSLKQNSKTSRLILGGDSAGGNLVMALQLKCKNEGLGLAQAIFLDSPWTDMTFSGASFRENWFKECLVPLWPPAQRLFQEGVRRQYAGDRFLEDPYLSPLFGDFQNFPPVHISYSESEQLRDDSVRLIQRLLAFQVEVSEMRFTNTPHANILFSSFYPESQIALDGHARFIAQHSRHQNTKPLPLDTAPLV